MHFQLRAASGYETDMSVLSLSCVGIVNLSFIFTYDLFNIFIHPIHPPIQIKDVIIHYNTLQYIQYTAIHYNTIHYITIE